MTKSDKALVILLRIVGVGALFALLAVVMPTSWMAATHRWLGLGEMPTGPVVEYLARSLSAFYAIMGALCLVLTTDLERYRPLVRFLGVAFALMSLVLGDSQRIQRGKGSPGRGYEGLPPGHQRRWQVQAGRRQTF